MDKRPRVDTMRSQAPRAGRERASERPTEQGRGGAPDRENPDLLAVSAAGDSRHLPTENWLG